MRQAWGLQGEVGSRVSPVVHLKKALSLPHCGSISPPPRTWESHTNTQRAIHSGSSSSKMQQSRETEVGLPNKEHEQAAPTHHL